MPVLKIDIKEISKLTGHLEGLIEGAANRAIVATAARVVAHILTVIIPKEPRQPVDRGAYRAGWHYKADPEGARVYNSMPYAAVVEYGARAENVKISRKMIDALAEWVIRKGLVKKATKKAGGVETTRMRARKVAWAIAQAMKKRGIFNRGQGLRILERALEIVPDAFTDELKTELERETE